MELAAVIDAGEPFVKATYILGDGLLVFSAYSTLHKLCQQKWLNAIIRMLLPKRTHWLQVQKKKQLFSNMPVHVFGQVSTTFCKSLICSFIEW